MKNKRMFLSLAFLIVCLLFITTAGTGCFYELGQNIGSKLKAEITATSGLISNGTDTTIETSETTESVSSSSNNTTEDTGPNTDDNTTTELSSTTHNADDNNQNVSASGNEIQLSFNMDYIFNVSGDVSNISFTAIVPKDYKDRQRIINSEYSIKPERIFNDGPNSYAEFNINNPPTSFEINIMDEIILSQYGLDTAINAGNKDFDVGDLDKYSKAEKYIESDDEDIKNIARSFKGEDVYALVQTIYNYVMDNMEWIVYVPEDVGAKAALIEKKGDCTSYSDLFIALLRAYGIPARMIEGYTINAADLSIGHNWVEVYFNDTGWVPFDPTFDDNNGSTSLFNNLDNIYVYFSMKRNDPTLNNFHYFVYNWYGSGKVEVLKNISVN
ncbi:MAG: transglutaminase-like domain-containing protein [Candidatus Humimicrobiaceae bacterium]